MSVGRNSRPPAAWQPPPGTLCGVPKNSTAIVISNLEGSQDLSTFESVRNQTIYKSDAGWTVLSQIGDETPLLAPHRRLLKSPQAPFDPRWRPHRVRPV